MEERLEQPEGLLVSPARPSGTGVLVLAGSSGRVEVDRARVLARAGALALAIRWFGGVGQQPGPFEVPLETFTSALDRLAAECDRVAVLGSSFGAEAALLTAVHDARVDAVVGIAPTPVVWAGITTEPDGVTPRQTSHWTLGGAVVPFMPFVEDWEPPGDPPAYRGLYERSLQRQPDAAARAAIPVERIRGDVVAIGGDDDQVWPGADFARAIAARRRDHALETTVVTHPHAGHRAVLPGESAALGGQRMARGGTPDADAALGAATWPHLVRALHLQP